MTTQTVRPIRREIAALGRCETCGTAFDGPGRRFCGGDRCVNVFVNGSVPRERTPSGGSLGYTGTYRERCADISEVSVVSVLEARGPE